MIRPLSKLSALGGALAVLSLALGAVPATARETESNLEQIKRLERDLLFREAQEHFREARERALHPEAALEGRVRRAVERAAAGDPRRPPAVPGAIAPAIGSAVTNVRVNDLSGDAIDASQNEPSIAVLGSDVLVAWNDWPDVSFGGSLQGYGYSTDGGATFTDGGELPAPAGAFWLSDPVLTVNQKTGEFFYSGLLETSVSGQDFNGVGMIRGSFSGSTFTWDTPQLVRILPDTQHFVDKPWIVADSSNGSLYVTYTDFISGSNSVNLQRSLDSGATWGPVITLNSAAGAGLVQGSRPAVGPNGEVYAVWKEIGTAEADFIRLRVSTTQGATFGSEQTVASIFDNFGTGAPGFNRERGIAFPAIAVDRTTGPDRGRIFVAWNEAFDWLDDAPDVSTLRAETEDNRYFAQANPFTPGETLTGSFQNTSDADTWAFHADQDRSFIFWCDTAPLSLYRMRVFCSDTATKLAYTGRIDSPVDPQNNQSIMMWTAPATGTYYLAMDYANLGSSLPGSYRIRTGLAHRGGERGRDQRDCFVASSLDGATWTTPVRLNDDLPHFDDWLPEVAVAPDQNVYAMWYDWRDSPAAECGGRSHIYAARSDNHGLTWSSLGAITEAQSKWSDVRSNLLPNQGDYLALFADENAAYLCWTDGRGGSPDIYAAAAPLLPDTLQVTGSATAAAGLINVTWQFRVQRVVSATVYRSVNGGARSAIGSVMTNAAGTATYADAGVSSGVLYTYGLGVLMNGGEVVVGEVPVTVPAGHLHARPNPLAGSTQVIYDLAPAGENVELTAYDIGGRRIRRLVKGFQSGGTHAVTWDARDDDGRLVHAGIYFIHLVHGGQSVTARVAVVP